MRACVYFITHVESGRRYVGKAVNPEDRWKQHVRGKRQRDSYIQRAIQKHGADAFRFEVVDWFDSEREAYAAERWWVAFLRSNVDGFGFNLSVGGEGNSGYEMPAHARDKISESSKRRWARPGERERNAEQTRRVHTGLKRSPETLKRLSEAHKGHVVTDEHKAKLSASGKGKKKPGTSAALKGRPKSPEHRAKIGAAHVGMKRSEETRRKMREAWARRRESQRGAATES